MAPRILSIASSAVFLIVLALPWLYNVLSNITMDSLASNLTNRCSIGVLSSGNTVRIITSCTGALAFAAAETWETLFHFSDGELVFFFLAQCFTWLAFTAICIFEKRQPRLVPFRGLARAWWTIAFLLVAIKMTALVIQRLGKNCSNPCSTVALAAATMSLVASLVLVVTAALECPSGKESNQTQLNGDVETTEPLLKKQGAQEYFGYAGASRLSKLTWRWMNPLLQKVTMRGSRSWQILWSVLQLLLKIPCVKNGRIHDVRCLVHLAKNKIVACGFKEL